MPALRSVVFSSLIAVSLSLFVANTAFAADAPTRPFGAAGQVAFGDIVALRTGGLGFLSVASPAAGSIGPVSPPFVSGLIGYEHGVVELPPDGTSRIVVDQVSISPSIDGFVRDRLSLGLTAALAYAWGGSDSGQTTSRREKDTARTVGLAPRIGYVIPLKDGLSLWPRVGVGFTYSRSDATVTVPIQPFMGSAVIGGTRFIAGADVGVVYQPTQRLFFSATPELGLSYSITGQWIDGTTMLVTRSIRARMAGTVGFGVLL